MSLSVINLAEKFTKIDNFWSPRIAGELNGQQVKLARLKGEFNWHHHETEDELFLVISGRLTIRLRDGELQLGPGEFVIIPRGVEHQPAAEEEVQVLLFEPAGTLNTGTERNTRSVDAEWI